MRVLGRGTCLPIMVAAGLVIVEGATLLGLAFLDLSSLTSERMAVGVGTALFFLVYGGGQVVAAVGLLRLAHWSRGPIVFTQLIQLGLAWGLRGAEPEWLAPLMAFAAVVVVVCVVLRSTTEALTADEPGPVAD